ncbi:MAG: tetraacyldisaccharide 4'-kinase [Elusimicrobia bacterium]|nr:tetraacyldisaccharide 4'-kinase [Elusimicrobiota bacterium]
MKPLKILYPFSFLYLLIFNISQKIKKIRQKKLACPVISVGNITVGGTGKTPTVIYLAELLKSLNKKVCVISRGYKRQGRGTRDEGRVVTDGNKVLLGAKLAGDEPYLIAKSLTDIPVLVAKNRYNAGLFAIGKFGVDTIMLDDGFQHLNLKRDVDIVCINALNPFGNSMLLPAGYLREPVGNIIRASAFIITRCDKITSEKLEDIESVIKKYNNFSPIFHAHFVKKIFHRSGTEIKTETLKGQNIIAVSGIAVPEDFEQTLKELGVNLLVHKKYPDHYFFKDSDIKKFYDDAAEFQAVIITTAKDATRLPEDFPCYVLDVKLEVQEKNEVKFFLEKQLAKKN